MGNCVSIRADVWEVSLGHHIDSGDQREQSSMRDLGSSCRGNFLLGADIMGVCRIYQRAQQSRMLVRTVFQATLKANAEESRMLVYMRCLYGWQLCSKNKQRVGNAR